MAQLKLRCNDWVGEHLVTRLNKDVWYRNALRKISQRDPILDERYERYHYEEQQVFIEAAVKEKVEVVKKEADRENGN